MAKLSVKNVKQASPPWMINITGSLAGITAALITMVNTMPAGVPQGVKDWILWGINGLSLITAVFAGATAFAKTADSTDPKDPPPPKP